MVRSGVILRSARWILLRYASDERFQPLVDAEVGHVELRRGQSLSTEGNLERWFAFAEDSAGRECLVMLSHNTVKGDLMSHRSGLRLESTHLLLV
jgi:hypothetical protein